MSLTFFFPAILSRTTDSNGQVQTQTVRSTQLTFPTAPPSNNGGSSTSSNVGAIAGGVVGGVLAILALILIIFCLLKRRKRTEDFDGNFDPDRLDPERFGGNATRPGTMPNIDLVGAEITPYVHQHRHQADALPEKSPQTFDPYAQMAQQPGVAVMGAEGSSHNRRRSDLYSSTTGSHYPTTVTGQSVTGLHHADFRGPSPGPSLVTSGTLTSSKDRESASERARLQVANSVNGEGGSSRRTSGVIVQHRDMARVPQQSVAEEIPPSYDSISPADRARSERG